MAKEVPVMKVKFGSSFMIINKSDFDPQIHEEWVAPAKVDKAKTSKAEAAADHFGELPAEAKPKKEKIKRETV